MEEAKKNAVATAIVAGALLALGQILPATAVAAETNGVQEGTQEYVSQNSAWSQTYSQGSGGGGKVDVIYDTSNGQWQGPGADKTDTSDNTSNSNGTYRVIIPKVISYTGKTAGNVSETASYDVTVRGVIPSGQSVKVTATNQATLTTSAGDAGITATTSQGKSTWTVDECFGSVNADGSLSGTSGTDVVTLSGVAKAAGVYRGVIAYASECK